MSIETSVKIRLQAFEIPDVAEEANRLLPTAPMPPNSYCDSALALRVFNLSEIPADTLERMCEDFTIEIFKRAKKSRPPRAEERA